MNTNKRENKILGLVKKVTTYVLREIITEKLKTRVLFKEFCCLQTVDNVKTLLHIGC